MGPQLHLNPTFSIVADEAYAFLILGILLDRETDAMSAALHDRSGKNLGKAIRIE